MSDMLNKEVIKKEDKKSIHEEQLKVFSKHVDELKSLEKMIANELESQREITEKLQKKLAEAKVAFDSQKEKEAEVIEKGRKAEAALNSAESFKKSHEDASRVLNDNVKASAKEAMLLASQREEHAKAKLEFSNRIQRYKIAESRLMLEKKKVEELIEANKLGITVEGVVI